MWYAIALPYFTLLLPLSSRWMAKKWSGILPWKPENQRFKNGIESQERYPLSQSWISLGSANTNFLCHFSRHSFLTMTRRIAMTKTRRRRVKFNTGKWTDAEKKLFLVGLRKFGKGRWKEIATTLTTRCEVVWIQQCVAVRNIEPDNSKCAWYLQLQGRWK